jgi:hypothetical protein
MDEIALIPKDLDNTIPLPHAVMAVHKDKPHVKMLWAMFALEDERDQYIADWERKQ